MDLKHQLEKLERYLLENKIPYHKNKIKIIINNSQKHLETNQRYNNSYPNNYIIPGAIIRILSKNKFSHESGLKDYEKTLVHWKNLGIKGIIYNYIYNLTPSDGYSVLDLNNDTSINHMGLDVKFISNLNEIIPEPYIYQINTSGPIYTFAIDDNVLKYSDYTYYITRNQYNRASSYMTDNELKSLHRVDLKIVDKIPDCCYKVFPSNKKKPNSDINYLTQFHHYMKYIPLPGGFRTPIRLIEGHTHSCDKCNNIFNNRYMKDNLCFKCHKLCLT